MSGNEKMNIVLLTIDTVRPDHLGCYGYSEATSPNIDWIAEGGVRFENAITNGSYTTAAFPALLSSTYASMYGGPFSNLDEHRPMVAEILKKHGYATGGFVTNPLLGKTIGYNRGFDTFVEEYSPADDRHWVRIKGIKRLLSNAYFQRSLRAIKVEGRPPEIYAKADAVTAHACSWLQSVEQPFFLWVHYMDAHWPYRTQAMLNTAEEYAQEWSDRSVMHRAYHAQYPGEQIMDRIVRQYDEAIRFMDEQIGRIIALLDRQNVMECTSIFLVSDHGEEFFEHGSWQHGASVRMYDELLRVPFLLKMPGPIWSTTIKQQTDLLDIGPTILDMAQIAPDPKMEGTSLLPLITGAISEHKSHIISEMVAPDWICISVRTEDYKYIYDGKRPEERKLYDLKADPMEIQNLSIEREEIISKFERILDVHLERISSTGPAEGLSGWHHDEVIMSRLRELGYIE